VKTAKLIFEKKIILGKSMVNPERLKLTPKPGEDIWIGDKIISLVRIYNKCQRGYNRYTKVLKCDLNCPGTLS